MQESKVRKKEIKMGSNLYPQWIEVKKLKVTTYK